MRLPALFADQLGWGDGVSISIGHGLKFLDQPELNTEGKFADFLLTVLAGIAQLERDILDEKRRDGIAAARARNVKFGRPTLVNDKP